VGFRQSGLRAPVGQAQIPFFVLGLIGDSDELTKINKQMSNFSIRNPAQQ
jgi:hypothetical protein